MDRDRWERVKRLFEAALRLEPSVRDEFVAENCPNDGSIKREVLSLLAAHHEADGFLEREAADLSHDPPSEQISLTFAPGELIAGRFKVLRFIRRGGMGEVYEAEDLELNERVALKTIRPKIASDPRTLAHFRQEIQLARRVAHPNVCRMHDVERHKPADCSKPEVLFLTMELLEGETLAERLSGQGKMTSAEALPLVRQMAEGLSAAHKAGVLHCDFKPSNVMLVREKPVGVNSSMSTESTQAPGSFQPPSAGSPGLRVVITDFGLARALRPAVTHNSESPHPAGWEGTLPYMSPEQLENGDCTPATDVYALGLVVYEMVTGHRPFASGSSWEEAGKRLKEPPPSPRVYVPDLAPGWEAAILRCLEISPAARFRSPRALTEELDPLFRSVTVSPPSTPGEGLILRPRQRRQRAALIALLLALVALAAAIVWTRRPGGVTRQFKSVAVLPLDSLSHDPDQDYFADGMTDALITDLAKISALRVISRHSVMQYKGPQGQKPLSEIARALKVDAVVEGTVLRSGQRVRISARLIDVRTGSLIWAEAYERDLQDVLTLQNEVASAIAEGVRINVTSQELARLAAKRPVNPQAYEAYLRGRHELNKGTEQNWKQARAYFERAKEIDPNYAPAYAGLADYYGTTDELPPSVAMAEAKKYARRALSLDPNLAEAYTSLAVVDFYADWNWPEAEKNFRRALELNAGGAEPHRAYSDFLSAMGTDTQALDESRQAERLDPVSVDTLAAVGWTLYYARHYDQALQQCRVAVDLEPASAIGHDCLGLAYLGLKNYDQAVAESEEAVRLSHNDLNRAVGLARAYALGGKKTEARRILAEARAKQTWVAPSLLAQIDIALSNRAQGLDRLEEAYAARDVYLARLKVEPAFDAVRSDSRFRGLIERLNFPP
jgi:serine/threonine-protein kinase